MNARPETLKQRIKSSVAVDPETGCWIWQKSVRRRYGRIAVGSKLDGTRRSAGAHRVSYEVFVGPIPEGLDIDHLCRTPLCCNPEHLEPVTRRENLLRGDTRPGRNSRKTACPRCGSEFRTRKNGTRVCQTCDNARCRANRARRREAAA